MQRGKRGRVKKNNSPRHMVITPSFMRLGRALLRQRGVHKMRGSDGYLKRSGTTKRSSTSIEKR